jgi:hypothetical protein
MDSIMTYKILAALISTALLSGCACDADDADDAVDTRTFKTDTPVAEPDARLIAFSGLYDTSKDNNESYFYISEAGLVTSFNYEGDAFGSGLNCYSTVNTGLNVTYDSLAQKYTLASDALTVTFTYDSVNGMHAFNDGTSTTDNLDIVTDDYRAYLGDAAADIAVNPPAIYDIEGMLCAEDA